MHNKKYFDGVKQIQFGNVSTKTLLKFKLVPFCKRWAVVTTIFKPSDAVRKVARNPDWCLVIVGDKKSLPERDYLLGLGHGFNKTVVFLTSDDQKTMFPLLSSTIPWNHFSRKNIGYAFAIKNGAELIWDFDDDNENVLPTKIVETSRTFRMPCDNVSHHLFNPYPFFSVNETYTWPRGFPLEHIRNDLTVSTLCNVSKVVSIGVIQSLANIQPDVDAIYRFTRDTPFNFGATPQSHLPVLVPFNTYAPFNGQATLWTKRAFIYMALPVSVTGRVSDIWRSYIAQYFFHQLSMHVMFVPPYIDQHRNVHDYLVDFNDELDLYQKSNQFLEWLLSLETTKVYDIFKLYSLMCERQYLKYDDLPFISAWLETFDSISKEHKQN